MVHIPSLPRPCFGQRDEMFLFVVFFFVGRVGVGRRGFGRGIHKRKKGFDRDDVDD